MAQVAVCSQINTKHINTVWAERTVLNVKLLVHHVIIGFKRLTIKELSIFKVSHRYNTDTGSVTNCPTA